MAKPTPLHTALGIDAYQATDEPIHIEAAGHSHVIVRWAGFKIMTRADFVAAIDTLTQDPHPSPLSQAEQDKITEMFS